MSSPAIEVFDDGVRVVFTDSIKFLGEGIAEYDLLDSIDLNKKHYDVFGMEDNYTLKALAMRFGVADIIFFKARDFASINNLFHMNDLHKSLFYIKYISLKLVF
jgi:hypothetical protein